MEYITIKEASKKWMVSERRIRQYIKDGRINNAYKNGMSWNIPSDTFKPYDKRFNCSSQDFIINIPDSFFDVINSKKNELDKKKNDKLMEMLRENDILEWIYNSNAIEGNSLTKKETKVVLEGITIGGKTLREHLEAINHKEAIIYLDELIKSDNTLTEWNIRSIHQLVLDTKEDSAYRKTSVIISGAKHKPSPTYKVPEEMTNLIRMYDSWSELHPIVRAGLLHVEFVKIHPFNDGNGRTARLLMNFEIMKEGFLPIIIKKEDRLKYYELLDKAHITSDYTDFIKMISKLEENALNEYLKIFNDIK